MTKPTADVTVVIPVKDRPSDVIMAVNSVTRQTVLPRAIIIVDDGSAVPVEISQFSARDDSIDFTVIRNAISLGGARSYNRAVSEARTPVVVLLDSDDMLMPSYIDVVSSEWNRVGADIALIATGFYWCTSDFRPYREQQAAPNVSRRALLERGNFVGGSSVFSVRREAFMKCGGCPTVYASYDWGLLLRISTVGRIHTIARPLVWYNSPSTSAGSGLTKSFRRQIISVSALLRTFCEEDRQSARKYVHYSTCLRLALANRRRMSWRLLRAYLVRYGLESRLLRIAFINLAGYRIYGNILRHWALWRAYARRKRWSATLSGRYSA